MTDGQLLVIMWALILSGVLMAAEIFRAWRRRRSVDGLERSWAVRPPYDWAEDIGMAQSSGLSVHRHPPEGAPSQGGMGPHDFEQDDRGRA